MRNLDVLTRNTKEYLNIFFFIFLVIVEKILGIYKYGAEDIHLIVFNNVTYLYVTSLLVLLFFLRNKSRWLFSVFLIFYTGFFIDLKYAIQPYTFPLGSNMLYKQVITIAFLLVVILLIFFLIKKYFKYVLTLFILKYLVAIVFLIVLKKQEYQKVDYNTNYKAEKNCYILLFDEYPSQYVINTFLHHQDLFLDDFIVKEKFNHLKTVRSNYINTEMSIPSILYGTKSSHFKVRDAINSLSENRFTRENHFVGYSLFDAVNSKDAINNSNFIHSNNSLLTRYFFPLLIRLIDGKGHGVFYNIDQYHQKAFELLEKSSHYRSNRKQVVFIHFFTPHDQVFSKRKNILDRIEEANQFMTRAVNIINKNDPNASIVIMSDHGYRGVEVPSFYQYNGLLMYRNIDLDTLTIKKNGIVSLFDPNKK